MIGETNSMVDYHVMAEGHSIQLRVGGGGAVSLTAGTGQHPGEG